MKYWIAALLAALPLGAQASTIVALPEPALIERADVIVFGTVVSTQTLLGEGGRVFTQAELQVQLGLRGARPGDVLVLQVPGGRLPNGVVAEVVGAPRLSDGQLVFGFLERRGDVVLPLGLAYGLLDVHADAKGGYRVDRNLAGLALRARDGSPVSPEAVALRDVPLTELTRRVATRLRELGLPAPNGSVP